MHRYWVESKGRDKIESYHQLAVGFGKFFRLYRPLEAERTVTTSRLHFLCMVETEVIKTPEMEKRSYVTLPFLVSHIEMCKRHVCGSW